MRSGAGSVNSGTGTFTSAAFMNRCHGSAGSVPPVTVGTPWMFSSGVAGSRYPIHTAVDSVGV